MKASKALLQHQQARAHKKHADTNIVACEHIFSSMRSHIEGGGGGGAASAAAGSTSHTGDDVCD
jgi:hypothetical protein